MADLSRRLRLAACLALLATFFVGSVSAAENKSEGAVAAAVDHTVIPGFERFFAASQGDTVSGGQLLLGELNCTACHKAEKSLEAVVWRKQAPILDNVGQRVKPSFVRAYLADPQAVKPGTTMPNLLAGLDAAERKDNVEALVHYLASTGAASQASVDRKTIANGEKLFHQVGCVACHGSRKAGAEPLATSVPLGDMARKYTIPGLAAFLQDPLKSRPSGRMPGIATSGNEATELANYLLRDVEVTLQPNFNFSYYEGAWQELPDFAKLTPLATGQTAGFDVGVARQAGGFALRFDGYLELARDGDYNFHLKSDDGSRLWIDDKLVVNNDGIHSPASLSGAARLSAGIHRVVAGVFNGGGGCELSVEIEGAGVGRQSIDALVHLTSAGSKANKPKPSANDDDRFIFDPALSAKGGQLFARLGCASCHQMKQNQQVVVSQIEAGSLSKLKPGFGCLATEQLPGVPQYALSARQRASLGAAIEAAGKGPAPMLSPKQAVARTMVAFNCYACHERDKVGGVEEARNAMFETDQKEMGDEGRLPPSLTGVGAKLNPQWMKQVFANGAKDRPYMHTRMPKYGEQNVGHLVEQFAALDPLEAVAAVTFKEPVRQIKSIGRHLVGDKAFGCIKCHNFKEYNASGIRGINMTKMTERLRHDWFARYVVNPQAYRPGTRMPSAWPDGKSVLKKVLDGNADQQVEAVWLFLTDAGNAATPFGLGHDPIELVAEKDAVMYRNFIEGAGPRAIGVGYPEKANLAFDANEMRIALIWQGAFIDASRHWTDRGAGFQPPLGDNVLSLAPGSSFARLKSEGDEWPKKAAKELGLKFRGYRLEKEQRPVFRYDFGPVHIEDFPNGVASANPGLRRTLALATTEPVEDLWFRAALAGKVEPGADGWFTVGDGLKLRLQSASKPVIRKAGDKMELVVPIKFENKQARVVEEFMW